MDFNLLNDEYWSHRYEDHQTGWDIGYASPPLSAYIDQLKSKDIAILVPGCGNAYEAAYLWQKGFTNITLVDISQYATAVLKQKFSHTSIRIIHQDFFDHSGRYDLVLEQTFFCALDPSFRKNYAEKMDEFIATNGKIAGVLFNRDFEGGPPFGGHLPEYEKLFAPKFDIKKIELCYNSIVSRSGTELFFILQKKN